MSVGNGDLHVPVVAGQDPDAPPVWWRNRLASSVNCEPSARALLVRLEQLGAVELLGQLDVDQLFAGEEALDVVSAPQDRERDRRCHTSRSRPGCRSGPELLDRDERPDRLVEDDRVEPVEGEQALVDRLLAGLAADDALEPVRVEAMVLEELSRLVEVGLRAGDDDPVDLRIARAFSSTWTMSGLPPSRRNCFGNGRPIRRPIPPASTTMPNVMRASCTCRATRVAGAAGIIRLPSTRRRSTAPGGPESPSCHGDAARSAPRRAAPSPPAGAHPCAIALIRGTFAVGEAAAAAPAGRLRRLRPPTRSAATSRSSATSCNGAGPAIPYRVVARRSQLGWRSWFADVPVQHPDGATTSRHRGCSSSTTTSSRST